METTAGEGSPGRIGKTGPWGGGSNRKGNKKGSKGIYLMGGGRKVALHDGRTAKKEWKRRGTSSETQQPTSITSTLSAKKGMA